MYPQGPVQDGLKARLVHIPLGEHVLGDGLAAHAPGQVGHPAVGLHVHKVAPPADELADEQPVDPQVGEGQEADLPHMAEDEQHDGRRDDGPVDGQPPVAVPEDGFPVQGTVHILIQIQIKDHIVGPDGDEGRRHRENHQIQDVVGHHAEPGGPLGAQVHRQQQSAGNDDAVPVHRPAEDLKGHPVQGKFQPKAGK